MAETQLELPKHHVYLDNEPEGVRNTSREAFFSILDKLPTSQFKVLIAIQNRGGISWDKRIAKDLGWDINRITPRRNELVKMGALRYAGQFTEPETKRKVTLWELAR